MLCYIYYQYMIYFIIITALFILYEGYYVMCKSYKIIKAISVLAILTLAILMMLSGCISNDGADVIVYLDGKNNRVSDEDKVKAINIHLAEDIKIQLLSFEYIEDALVVVNLDVSQTSPDDVEKVSVLLTILNDDVLAENEINSIFDIILGMVSGITYEDISLTDTNLNFYKLKQ